MNKQYTFFWNGPLSQWYQSNFKVGGITFNTAEQYMMYHKAMMFGDTAIAKQILNTGDPKTQKALGRKVAGFKMSEWNKQCIQIVYRGNHAKFTQNQYLYKALMNTGTTTLVEASPFDTIWGIGLDEKTARVTPEDDWKGTNWLGLTLTQLREFLKDEEEIERKEKLAQAA